MSMKVLLKMIKKHFPNCSNFKKCGRKAISQRAKFCGPCFKAGAARSGARSGGNRTGNPGNSGNIKKGISKKKAGACSGGNRTGNPGNSGNIKKGISKKKAGALSGGNAKKGNSKKKAGARSGVKRSSKVALVVKKRWLNKILDGEKDWEIRSSNTSRRGWIHLAESKACGKLMGRARLVDCFELSKSQFGKSRCHHCVRYLSEVPYKRMFAWVLNDAERFEKPFMYEHAQGAVIWVRLMPETKCGRPRSAGVRPL